MDHVKGSEIQKYYCDCTKVYLRYDELQAHLSLPLNYRISKIRNLKTPSENYKKSIFRKIQAILQTQTKIQQYSDQLIQSIVSNTLKILSNLNRLIDIYKDLLIYPHFEVESTDIINAFKIDLKLTNSIGSHFQQKAVDEISSQVVIRKNLKDQVNQLLDKGVGFLYCMEFFKDEKNFVTGGTDGAIRFWDIQNKSQIYSLFKHKRCVRSIALGFDDELILSGSEDMTVRLWNAKSKKQLHIFNGHTSMVMSVLFSWDNKTALSGSSDSSIRIWNLERKTIQQTIVFDIIIFQICLISQGNIAVAAGINGRVSFLI